MELSIFDFDGTITRKDTFVEFIKYAVGFKRFAAGMAAQSVFILLYYLRIFPEGRVKERVIDYFFRNWSEDRFKETADRFARKKIPVFLRQSALDRIAWHQQKGHKVVVVSASLDSWIRPWCEDREIDVIATRLEVREQRLTGRFATRNCAGAEKVKRLRQALDLSRFTCVHAYGDSRGDREMLDLADRKYYRYFA